MNPSATNHDTAIAGNLTSRSPSWIYWFLFAAIAGPIGIVLHELGHFLVAHAFGFPDVVLHFGSVSDGGTEAGAPQWQLGMKAGADPFVTLALLGICCGATVRFGAQPWIVAPGFAIGSRSALVGLAYLSARIRGSAGTANLDELIFARALGLSMDAVVLAAEAAISALATEDAGSLGMHDGAANSKCTTTPHKSVVMRRPTRGLQRMPGAPLKPGHVVRTA